MQLKDLRVGDIVRNGEHIGFFVGASDHPTLPDMAIAVMARDGDIFHYREISWDAEIGFLLSYRNNNLTELDKIFNG